MDTEQLYSQFQNAATEDAENIIIDKYKNCILTILKGFLKEYNIIVFKNEVI